MESTRLRAALGWLERRRKGTSDATASASAVPPYVQSLEILAYTIRQQRRVGVVAGIVALGLLGWQQARIYRLTNDLRDQDFLVVPGAADFMRVRPNLVGDEAVRSFAQYFTERLVSVSYLNLEARYETMARHMAPALWALIQRDLEDTARLFRAVQATEVMHLEKIEAVRKNLDGGAGFVATLNIVVDRFLGERKLESRDEVVTVVFRTSGLSADSPWLFEVEEFVRRTPEEHRKYILATKGAK